MTILDAAFWGGRLVLTRDLKIPAERSEFFRSARRGDFVRVQRGVWMPQNDWSALDHDQRYRALVIATAAYFGNGAVFSHHSAAAIWKLPWLGPWPTKAHVLGSSSIGGKSTGTITRHDMDRIHTIDLIDGLRVTSLLDTVVDLARVLPHHHAVVVLDAALRRTEHPLKDVPRTNLRQADLLERLSAEPHRKGHVRAAAAIDFADGRADRPGESLSRVSISRAKLTAPELQVPMRGASGRQWVVDFWWPEFNVIGEFDGESKYTDPEFLHGRTPAQAVIDEKWREDDLRATGRGMTRWGWSIAQSIAQLRTQLTRAGVR
jgi:hypothetical protein